MGRRLDRLGADAAAHTPNSRARARDYWAANCFAGISPFTDDQVPLEELARPSTEYQPFAIGCNNAMFGVDYPHFESVFPETNAQVDALVQHPSISADVSRKILCRNTARVYGFDLAGGWHPTSNGSASRSTGLPRWAVAEGEADPWTAIKSRPLRRAAWPSQRAGV